MKMIRILISLLLFMQTDTFAFHKVVQRHYSGEVGDFTYF